MVQALAWPELTPKIHYTQVTESAGDGAFTLTLKPRSRVNQSLKQRVSVAPQSSDLSPQMFTVNKGLFSMSESERESDVANRWVPLLSM